MKRSPPARTSANPIVPVATSADGEAYARRLAGLQALAAEDAAELRALTPEAGMRVLEDLLDAGFEMIHAMIEDARREGRDAARLALFLMRDEAM